MSVVCFRHLLQNPGRGMDVLFPRASAKGSFQKFLSEFVPLSFSSCHHHHHHHHHLIISFHFISFHFMSFHFHFHFQFSFFSLSFSLCRSSFFSFSSATQWLRKPCAEQQSNPSVENCGFFAIFGCSLQPSAGIRLSSVKT